MALPKKLLPLAREGFAFVRQAFLLPRDGVGQLLPERVDDGDQVVVFVHGLFATAGVLRPLRQRVGRHRGIRTAAFTHRPGMGVADVARRLEQLVSAFPPSARVQLVGHSLGGLVARYFAVVIGNERVTSTIALATPFGGIRSAALLGLDSLGLTSARELARDLSPESELLRRIRSSATAQSIPHLSILPGADSLSCDPVLHALPGGDVIVVPNIGHNTVLYDSDAIQHVEQRVLSLRHSPRG